MCVVLLRLHGETHCERGTKWSIGYCMYLVMTRSGMVELFYSTMTESSPRVIVKERQLTVH